MTLYALTMDGPSAFDFRGPGCWVVRRDYGYPPVQIPGWRVVDLGREGLVQALPSNAGGRLILRQAEILEGWSRTRSGRTLWKDLLAAAGAGGVLFECRFPKHARGLTARLRSEGAAPLFREDAPSGGIPPLYERLVSQPALFRLHLEHEWWTAMGAARGGVALLRIAMELALRGPVAAPELAGRLGVTSGAVRSYLRWMEDVALLRREGSTVHLRHPLLASLFERPSGHVEAPPAAPQTPSSTWDPIELD
jgi:hypothetical protein